MCVFVLAKSNDTLESAIGNGFNGRYSRANFNVSSFNVSSFNYKEQWQWQGNEQ